MLEIQAGRYYWYWDKYSHKPSQLFVRRVSASGFYFCYSSHILYCSFQYADGKVFDDFYKLPGIDKYLSKKRKKIAQEKKIEDEKWKKRKFVLEHYPNNPDPDCSNHSFSYDPFSWEYYNDPDYDGADFDHNGLFR